MLVGLECLEGCNARGTLMAVMHVTEKDCAGSSATGSLEGCCAGVVLSPDAQPSNCDPACDRSAMQ